MNSSYPLVFYKYHNHRIILFFYLFLQLYEDIDLIGINYKDEPNEAKNWLSMRGNPYRIIIKDSLGDLALDLGVYGVPETYVIDENQIIRYKHIGPINGYVVENEIMPLINAVK